MSSVMTVARHELTLIRSEIMAFAVYFVMPIVIIAFVSGTFDVYLQFVDPVPGATGADLAAPGQATMFGFMTLAGFGYFFLGEYGWGTWNRMRALGVPSWQILAGKLTVVYVHQLVLFSFVMGVSSVFFGLSVAGPLAAVVVIEAVVALVVTGYGFLVAALSATQAQFNAFAYLGALVLAGLGGALVPFTTLPGWAQAIAPATPTYWAVSAFETVVVDGGSIVDVTTELGMLAIFVVVLFGAAAAIFNPDPEAFHVGMNGMSQVTGLDPGWMVVEYPGFRRRLSPADDLTFGRSADLVIDENPFMHRVVGRIVHRQGTWWVQNHSSKAHLTVSDPSANTTQEFGPSAQVPILGTDFTVRFTFGPTTYELTGCRNGEPYTVVGDHPVDATRTVDFGAIPLSPEQHLAVVALYRSRLRLGRLAESKTIATELGWTAKKFNRKVDAICDNLSAAGVPGVKGGLGTSALARREALVNHAVAAGLVGPGDLGLLD